MRGDEGGENARGRHRAGCPNNIRKMPGAFIQRQVHGPACEAEAAAGNGGEGLRHVLDALRERRGAVWLSSVMASMKEITLC